MGLRDDVTPTVNDLFNLTADSVWIEMLRTAINRPFASDRLQQLTVEDVQDCIKVLLWLHFYGCSHSNFFSKANAAVYAPAADFRVETWKRFLKGLSFNHTSNHIGMTWTPIMREDNDLKSAQRGKTCCKFT